MSFDQTNKPIFRAAFAFQPQGSCPIAPGKVGMWLNSSTGLLQTRNADGTDESAVVAKAVNLWIDPVLGRDSNDGRSVSTPVQTTDKLQAIKDAIGTGVYNINWAAGTYPASGAWMLGTQAGKANPEAWFGTFTDELGTRTSSAASANEITDSTIASFRVSQVASITTVTGASGLARVATLTGLVGLVAGDAGSFFKFALWRNAGNNGAFQCLSVISPTSGTFAIPQAVVENNSLGYVQDSYETESVEIMSGALTGQVRQIADHGSRAKGSFLVAGTVTDGDTFVLNDGTNSPTTFTWKNSPSAGTDVQIGGDVNASAANAVTKINAQLPTALRVRAWSTAGQALVTVENMLPGSSGNQTISKTGTWTPTITSFAGGVGTPTGTFTFEEPLGSAPTAGDTFKVRRAGTVITFSSIFTIVGPANTYLGLRGIKFVNLGSGPTSGMTLQGMPIYTDRCKFDMRNQGGLSLLNGAALAANPLWVNDGTNNFASFTRRFAIHNASVIVDGFSRLIGRMVQRCVTGALGSNTSAGGNFQFVDFEYVTWILDKGATLTHAASGSFNGRWRNALASTDDMLSQKGKSVVSQLTQLVMRDSPNNAISVREDSTLVENVVLGFNNAKVGVLVDDGCFVRIDAATATATALTGTLGDFECGRETSPMRPSYATVRTVDANGVKGFPGSADANGRANYRYRIAVG